MIRLLKFLNAYREWLFWEMVTDSKREIFLGQESEFKSDIGS
ncbi:MAG: hypothetical protein AAF215_08430 [Cyanobacteria bacterium P01_A01_bin.123]